MTDIKNTYHVPHAAAILAVAKALGWWSEHTPVSVGGVRERMTVGSVLRSPARALMRTLGGRGWMGGMLKEVLITHAVCTQAFLIMFGFVATTALCVGIFDVSLFVRCGLLFGLGGGCMVWVVGCAMLEHMRHVLAHEVVKVQFHGLDEAGLLQLNFCHAFAQDSATQNVLFHAQKMVRHQKYE